MEDLDLTKETSLSAANLFATMDMMLVTLLWFAGFIQSRQKKIDYGCNTLNYFPRMLGYSSGQPTTKSHFGSVPSTFAMDDVSCLGNETSLLDCPHVTVDNCGSHEAAGVICSNSGPIESN